MELLFLGTGAADWKGPDPKTGEMRRNTAALLDGRVLIDCGPDVPEALAAFGGDATRVSDVLLTHSHGDHFSLDTLRHLADARGDGPRLRLWAHPAALKQAAPANDRVQFCPVQPGNPDLHRTQRAVWGKLGYKNYLTKSIMNILQRF